MRLDTERQLPLSLIIGDINGLKLVNDAYGHLEGDKLIKVVAEIFKKATRSEDIVARWGGDEFAILLPQTSLEEASAVTNRVIDLCSKSMYEIIKPSVAIGIATKTNSNQNINEILSAAEEKMYTQKMDEGPKMRQNLLQNLLNTLNKKVTSNKKHTDNMENIIEQYCTFYNLDAEELVQCKTLARYHDIGRIIIDPEILNKVEPLSDSEWTKIKTHSEIGSRLIATIPELQQFAPIILQHHERFDGTGYPLGLKGNDISEKARLLTILDSYEAMTSDRVYRPTKTHDEAINEILRCTGTQFDPELVKKFIKIFEKANN
jgi:diguanylate cyclase (GGDEF)-like protein